LLRSRWPGEYPKEWDVFEEFLSQMGERPSREHQLRRVDRLKPWSKVNAQWLLRVPGGRKGNRSEDYTREAALRHYYGITVEDYDRMLAAQGGKCALCQKATGHFYRNKPGRLGVDHCHETKKIRGLLCNNCNRGLGHFKDNPASLERAITYLRKHEKNEAA